MDPIANINEQLQLADAICNAVANDDCESADLAELAARLAELVQELDSWRRKGGFDPYCA